jgi:archaeal type IV pilus assembly protein PilA
MNVFGQSERSWRKARKRAVSPIIATILLVAITVVLAAVLYVLISGLTHGPGSTPIGSAFTAGNPVSSKCTAAQATAKGGIAGACVSGDWIYTLTVETSTISFASALFEVKTSAGAILSGSGGTYGFAITVVNGTSATVVNGLAAAAMTAVFSAYSGIAALCNGAACTTSTSLTSIYSIVVDMGTANPAGLGYSFVAVGTGSYSGTTSPLALP